MNRFEAIYMHPWTIRYLKRPIKRYIWPAFFDGLLIIVAFFASLSVWFAGRIPTQYSRQISLWLPLVALIFIGTNYKWHIYNRLWRYATSRDVIALLEATGLATLSLLVINMLQGMGRPFPSSQILLGGIFAFLLMFIVRCRHFLLVREMPIWRTKPEYQHSRVRVLMVGAGDHGRRLARHFRDDPHQRTIYEAVGFVDDDQTKVGLTIHGLKVLGTCGQIPALVRQHAIDQIVIAASRTSFGDSFEELISICQKTPAQIKVMPRLHDLLDQQMFTPNLRDLTIEDLLERDTARIDKLLCHQALARNNILVTGAGGSIGSELCRQLLCFNPARLLLVDNNETSLHDLHLELMRIQNSGHTTELVPLVADITTTYKLETIFRYYKPQIVYHAAAYKHVPMMEMFPDEAVRVNIMGTMILTDLADRFGTDRFIYVSTDKAVNPSSVMGASKRIGEIWLDIKQRESRTCFTSVRFGNVVGSRGSVVPLFNRQIEQGGPVTITDPRMTRYFMSIPEAATLIIQAGAFAQGGEIYMLDMGQPIRIVDLARKMIRLKGLRPGKDIQIKFVGIRPGEKLHEELSYQVESKCSTPHPKIYCLENNLVPIKEELLQQIAVLIAASQSNPEMIGQLGKGILFIAQGDVDSCLEALANITLWPQKRWSTPKYELNRVPMKSSSKDTAVPLRPVVLGERGFK